MSGLVTATRPPSMAVEIGAEQLPLEPSHPLNPRIDLVCLQLGYGQVITGNPTPEPPHPSNTNRAPGRRLRAGARLHHGDLAHQHHRGAAMKCLACNQDTHRHACDHCVNNTRRELRWLELYTTWLHMPLMLEPTRGTTGRRQPGYQSRPPARDDVLVMLDRRSRDTPTPIDEDRGIGLDDDEQPGWSILGSLHGIAMFVRHTADHSRPRQVTVIGEIGYLLAHIDWAANHSWVDDVIADIHNLHNQARNLCHDRPHELAKCMQVDCTGKVFWMLTRDHTDKARCVECGRIYTGLDLVRLRVNEEVAG